MVQLDHLQVSHKKCSGAETFEAGTHVETGGCTDLFCSRHVKRAAGCADYQRISGATPDVRR